MRAFVIFGVICCIFGVSQGGDLCPRVRNRNQWGAQAAESSTSLNSQPSLVLVKEAGSSCKNRALCIAQVKKVQNHDMLVDKLPDIDCNFVIGADGQVYEGRGWSNTVYNKHSIVICMLGSFNKKAPASLQTSTLKDFLTCSYNEDKLSSNYKVKAWKDVSSNDKNNPGSFLYLFVQSLHGYVFNVTE